MGQHLRVGLRAKGHPVFLQAFAEGIGVYDDSVVDRGDALVCIQVGVGVFLCDAAMGGPAGVGDARGSLQVRRHGAFQLRDPAHPANCLQPPAVDLGNARRVISAVLQPPEPIQENGRCIP